MLQFGKCKHNVKLYSCALCSEVPKQRAARRVRTPSEDELSSGEIDNEPDDLTGEQTAEEDLPKHVPRPKSAVKSIRRRAPAPGSVEYNRSTIATEELVNIANFVALIRRFGAPVPEDLVRAFERAFAPGFVEVCFRWKRWSYVRITRRGAVWTDYEMLTLALEHLTRSGATQTVPDGTLDQLIEGCGYALLEALPATCQQFGEAYNAWRTVEQQKDQLSADDPRRPAFYEKEKSLYQVYYDLRTKLGVSRLPA